MSRIWPAECMGCGCKFYWWKGKDTDQCECGDFSTARMGGPVPIGYLLITEDEYPDLVIVKHQILKLNHSKSRVMKLPPPSKTWVHLDFGKCHICEKIFICDKAVPAQWYHEAVTPGMCIHGNHMSMTSGSFRIPVGYLPVGLTGEEDENAG